MVAQFGIPDACLLGRDAELGLLEQGLAAAAQGRGGLVLVSGEPGIGKSALVEAVKRRAEAKGFSIAVGRAWEFADAPPWFPLRNCLRALGIDLMASLPDDNVFMLWEQVLESLAQRTRDVPQLWIIEDLHAADLQTLDLLIFLTQPLGLLKALVVVTSRLEDPRISEHAAERLSRMARDGVDLRLEQLEPELVHELARRTARRELSSAVLEQLVELSGGNPLFVLEYARAFASARGHASALDVLPHSVQQVVLARVRWLPEATQRALGCSSVLGREFSAALVARVLTVLPARVIDDLIPALRAGLITEGAPGQFRFSHVLVRDAIYEAVPRSERSSHHASLAQAVVEGAGEDSLILAAQHALLGLPISDVRTTDDLVDRAVVVLNAQGAFDRAFALWQQADGSRTRGLLPAREARQRLQAAALGRAAGRFADARAICEAALATARADADAMLLAEAALALGAVLQPGVVDQTLVAALEEARRLLPPEQHELGCLVLARLAAALQPAPDTGQPIAMARVAIAEARTLGKPELLREVLYFAGSALVDFAPQPERLAAALELLSLSDATGHAERALQASMRLALEHAVVGDFSAFSADVERALGLSDTLGRAPRYRWRPLLLVSMRAAARGDFETSERAIVEVEQLAAHCDDPALKLTLLSHRLLTLRLQRRDAEVDALLPTIEELMRDVPLGEAMYAMIKLSISARQGDLPRTRAALAKVEPFIERFFDDADFAALTAEGIAFAGSDEIRRTLRERMAGGAPELSMGHVVMVYEGPRARVLAALDHALGDTQSARDRLDACLETARARGHLPWVAQLEHDLGKLLLSQGQNVEARRYLEDAAKLADELGMHPLARQARALEGAPESTPAEPPPSSAGRGFALSLSGDTWQVRFDGRSFAVRDTRGMQLLARLVERPGTEVHVLALSGDDAQELVEESAGDVLDAPAREAYRRRLVELEVALDEAELDADRARLERLQQERQFLVQELSRAVGLAGRPRQAGSATERARVNVRKRLKQAIAKVEQVDLDAGRYLAQALRTGSFCSFRP